MIMCLGANRTHQPVTSIGPQVRLNALDRPENAAVRRTPSVRQLRLSLREQIHCERPRPAAHKCRAKSKHTVRELANQTERAWSLHMEAPASTAGRILPQSIAEHPPPPPTVPATISPEQPGETNPPTEDQARHRIGPGPV